MDRGGEAVMSRADDDGVESRMLRDTASNPTAAQVTSMPVNA